jgi:hypothetical protein
MPNGFAMSDWYQALIDSRATAETASALADKAIGVLVAQKIILPEPNSNCVLGAKGYPPGPALLALYDLNENECSYWDLLTNGMEITVGRWFNTFGTTVLDWLACPHCGTQYQLEGEFGDRFGDEIGNWRKARETSPIICRSCDKGSLVYEWQSKPHLGFSLLTFQFWNWPAFDAPGWKIDVPELLSVMVGHPLIRTWGRL